MQSLNGDWIEEMRYIAKAQPFPGSETIDTFRCYRKQSSFWLPSRSCFLRFPQIQ